MQKARRTKRAVDPSTGSGQAVWDASQTQTVGRVPPVPRRLRKEDGKSVESLHGGEKMKDNELSTVAAEIARFVIEQERVNGEDYEWWLGSLAVEVAFEADDRGYENASEISGEAVRLYRKEMPKPSQFSDGG